MWGGKRRAQSNSGAHAASKSVSQCSCVCVRANSVQWPGSAYANELSAVDRPGIAVKSFINKGGNVRVRVR